MTALRIAACQYAPKVGNNAENLRLAAEWMAMATQARADLVVLPELSNSGYVFESDEEAQQGAVSPIDSPYVHEMLAAAQNSGATIVAGITERGEGCRYNSAVVVDASGVRAVYRKIHRFHNEQDWFAAGEETVVVETRWGKLGVLICYDLWFPEIARSLAIAGADVIAVPTNWVDSFKPKVYDESGYCQGDYVAMVTAAQNGVAVACADRVGEERGVRFLGASIIVAPDGWPVAGPANPDSVELLTAEIDLEDVARARRRTPRNHLLDDRRPDSYNARVVPLTEQLTAPSLKN